MWRCEGAKCNPGLAWPVVSRSGAGVPSICSPALLKTKTDHPGPQSRLKRRKQRTGCSVAVRLLGAVVPAPAIWTVQCVCRLPEVCAAARQSWDVRPEAPCHCLRHRWGCRPLHRLQQDGRGQTLSWRSTCIHAMWQLLTWNSAVVFTGLGLCREKEAAVNTSDFITQPFGGQRSKVEKSSIWPLPWQWLEPRDPNGVILQLTALQVINFWALKIKCHWKVNPVSDIFPDGIDIMRSNWCHLVTITYS